MDLKEIWIDGVFGSRTNCVHPRLLRLRAVCDAVVYEGFDTRSCAS